MRKFLGLSATATATRWLKEIAAERSGQFKGCTYLLPEDGSDFLHLLDEEVRKLSSN
ncbi:hypothetical protein [Salsuginibacillus kocurii]|uniref:hypothetical protein n=1 Tax=Salsuginibacillus kocurii TaxID=427078 RepID=UPI00035F43C9|nr:hypothetical protein [Salsuginibacillus kocurii]